MDGHIKSTRVGDSPIIGAGIFVDPEIGAACATGLGEAIIKICGSHTIVEQMRNCLSPEEACKVAIERIKKSSHSLDNLQVGFIAMNIAGEVVLVRIPVLISHYMMKMS